MKFIDWLIFDFLALLVRLLFVMLATFIGVSILYHVSTELIYYMVEHWPG